MTADNRGSESSGRRPRRRDLRLPLTDDRSWSIPEVAYVLGICETHVRNLERSGQLPALPRIGKRVLFDPKVVRAFREGWRPPPGSRIQVPASSSQDSMR